MLQNYTITGQVGLGHGKGKQLGAPTANLDISLAQEHNMVPGLYTCQIKVKETSYLGLLYYGFNSLTKEDCLEAYLFGFDGDLYGQTLNVTTTTYLREPRAFTSEAELKRQITEDINNALK